jgi:ribosomal protein S18 acetylase RimI-like enzyme
MIIKPFMNDSLIIRPITKSEISFLDKMLYNAIFVLPGNERLPDNIIEHPEISKYIKDFGREGDSCFVAEINGELVGAIWIRHFNETNKAYGFVDSGTPELSMAVYEQFRKKGIGTMLLNTMIKTLTDKGYRQISLSVDIINYAYDLYKKIGFIDYKLVGESMTMIMKLK